MAQAQVVIDTDQVMESQGGTIQEGQSDMAQTDDNKSGIVLK